MRPLQYRFTVTGRGDFPVDMLRYDRAVPADDATAQAICRSMLPDQRGAIREYRLIGEQRPTIGRWASFNWGCTEARAGFAPEPPTTPERDALIRIVRFVEQHDAQLDDENQPGGPKVPTGDDYNDVVSEIRHIVAILDITV